MDGAGADSEGLAQKMVPLVHEKMEGGSLPVSTASKQAEGTAADVHHCETTIHAQTAVRCARAAQTVQHGSVWPTMPQQERQRGAAGALRGSR